MIRKGNFNVEVEQVHFLSLSLSQALAWLVEPEKSELVTITHEPVSSLSFSLKNANLQARAYLKIF